MGGRLDATNATQPVVSVLTPIALDHQKWLGNTLAEIAAEKAGIIKAGVPVVSAQQMPEAEQVIRAKADELGVGLEFIPEAYMAGPIALPGAHQQHNAALALAALHAAGIEVSAGAIAQGLRKVEWPARFQRFSEHIIIDGAHNPAGAQVLVETWRELFGDEKATLVFGALVDKDVAASWGVLREIAAAVVLPQFRGERVVPPAEVATRDRIDQSCNCSHGDRFDRDRDCDRTRGKPQDSYLRFTSSGWRSTGSPSRDAVRVRRVRAVKKEEMAPSRL